MGWRPEPTPALCTHPNGQNKDRTKATPADPDALSGLGGQRLVGVQDTLGVQESLELLHEPQGLGRLAVAKDALLLEADTMLRADAAPLPRSPLIHIGLQVTQQRWAEGLCCHIEVQVAIPCRDREPWIRLGRAPKSPVLFTS